MSEIHYTLDELRAFAAYTGTDSHARFAAQLARSALFYIDELKEEVYSYREGYEYWRGEAWRLEVELSK